MTRAILTCSPHFIDPALNELRRKHPQFTVLHHVAPGYILLQVPGSFGIIAQPWQRRLPIYLHHLFPVHSVFMLDGTRNDLTRLKQLTRKITPLRVTVQVRNTIESELPYMFSEVQHILNGNPHTVSTQPPICIIVSTSSRGYTDE